MTSTSNMAHGLANMRGLASGAAITALLVAACGQADQKGGVTGSTGVKQPVTGKTVAGSREEEARRNRADSTNPRKVRKPSLRYTIGRQKRERPATRPGPDRDRYQKINDNPIRIAAENPVSTFSVDVDTGAYANVRRHLRAGRLPPADAVRIEELVNYFPYSYAGPANRTRPFAVHTAVMKTPWNKASYLVRIGIKGYDIKRSERPAANLVFLVDVSGSMHSRNKLPLVIASLKMLTQQLKARDRISLVVYAGRTAVVLEPTPGNQKGAIIAALERLKAGGSTAGASGLKLAYAMAQKGFIKGGINRVILATDGDFNVGVTNIRALKDIVIRHRKTGITLTTLGYGRGNYNEHLMEQVANVGNGNYAYIDSVDEARKVLVQEMSSTLFTIAKDVKIQVEFNPRVVAEYRLIGYVNRKLRREDFRNDKVDAGDIGAGHTVTAIYEVTLVGGKGNRIRPLRYGAKTPAGDAKAAEFAHLRLRYKLPNESRSKLIETPLQTAALKAADKLTADAAGNDSSDASASSAGGQARADFRFSVAVAAWGQLLRGGRYTSGFSHADIIKLARSGFGADPHGYRRAFVRLVEISQSLTPKKVSTVKQ